jgi:hypothetical protein
MLRPNLNDVRKVLDACKAKGVFAVSGGTLGMCLCGIVFSDYEAEQLAKQLGLTWNPAGYIEVPP